MHVSKTVFAAVTLVAAAALVPAQALADTSPVPVTSAPAVADSAGLRVTSSGNRTVWLAWDPVTDATKYTVKVAVAANPDNIPSPALGTVTYTSETAKVAGLTNGVTYSFQVAPTVGGKIQAYSDPILGAPTPGQVPADLTVLSIGNGQTYLDFAPSDRATAYKLTITVVDANGNPSPNPGTASAALATSTATATNLSNGVEYGFTVAAMVDGQYTNSSTQVTATPQPVPNKPGTPTVSAATTTSLSLKWTASTITGDATAVDGYKVTYWPTETGVKQTEVVSTNTAVLEGLTPGASYTAFVQPHNSFGYGPRSVNVTAIPANKPGAVMNLKAQRVDANTAVNLAWGLPAGVSASQITKYTVATSPAAGAASINTADRTATVTGLLTETNYKFTVTAYTSGGAGGTSIIGSLANMPVLDKDPSIDLAGAVTMTFTPTPDTNVVYQAQALNIDRLTASPKPAGLKATTTIVADSVTCASGLCTATWKNFGKDGYVNGNTWTFQARATDGSSYFSNWNSRTPDAPVDASSMVVAYPDTAGSYHVDYNGNWDGALDAGIYSMTVNGAPAPLGKSGPLGQIPGNVTVELLGLGGTSSTVVALPDKFPPVSATGGFTRDYNGWRYHYFLPSSPGTFSVVSGGDVTIIAVGGGGAGGAGDMYNVGGSGGGGQVIQGKYTLKTGNYTVRPGSGGASGYPWVGSPGGATQVIGTGLSITAGGGGSGSANGASSSGGYNGGGGGLAYGFDCRNWSQIAPSPAMGGNVGIAALNNIQPSGGCSFTNGGGGGAGGAAYSQWNYDSISTYGGPGVNAILPLPQALPGVTSSYLGAGDYGSSIYATGGGGASWQGAAGSNGIVVLAYPLTLADSHNGLLQYPADVDEEPFAPQPFTYTVAGDQVSVTWSAIPAGQRYMLSSTGGSDGIVCSSDAPTCSFTAKANQLFTLAATQGDVTGGLGSFVFIS